jgi:hypothetical protein
MPHAPHIAWLLLTAAAVTTACSRDRRGPTVEAETSSHDAGLAGSTRPARRLPDAARCDALKLKYEQARLGSDRCERDDECSLELRGRFYTALDGCLRMSRRDFDGAPADRIAEEWLHAGCAGEFQLCPVIRSSAACRGGVCKEKPPPPIGEDWARVDVQETLTIFLPPELVEVPHASFCGNGPAVRTFHGPGLDVRVEFGHELSHAYLLDKEIEGPLPPRVIARTKKAIGTHEATLLDVQVPDINSKATAPDGTWPRYRFVRALLVQNVDALPRGGLLGVGTGPVGLSISIEGERARDEVAARIFETLSFW